MFEHLTLALFLMYRTSVDRELLYPMSKKEPIFILLLEDMFIVVVHNKPREVIMRPLQKLCGLYPVLRIRLCPNTNVTRHCKL